MNHIKLLCIGLLLSGSLQAGGAFSSEPAPAAAAAQPTQEEQLRLINIRILELELEQSLRRFDRTAADTQEFIDKMFDLNMQKLQLTLKDEDVTDAKIEQLLACAGITGMSFYKITIVNPLREAGKTNKEIYVALWGQLESDRIARSQQPR